LAWSIISPTRLHLPPPHSPPEKSSDLQCIDLRNDLGQKCLSQSTLWWRHWYWTIYCVTDWCKFYQQTAVL